MLNYTEFQPYESGNRPLFRFKKLIPINEQEGLYACTQTNLRYRVIMFHNHHQVALLHALTQKGVFGNIKGFLKKKNLYFCFTDVGGFETLEDFVEKQKGSRQCFSEAFCSQLIESVLEMGGICEEVGCILKMVSPQKVIVREKDGFFTFQLVYPYCHSLFQGLSSEIVKKEAQFCAPEILNLIDSQYELIRRTFPKAILYSMGLIVLFCFDYRIKSEERILALKNSKQFTVFLKAIRKEIKVQHQGKFISKVIKIAMEQSDLVRDNIQTFFIKINSPQLQTLRKFIFRPMEPSSGQIYIPTVYSDHSDKLNKWSLNRTIQIQGSDINNTNKSQLYSPQNTSLLRPGNGNPLYASFKKSPQHLYRNGLHQSSKYSFKSRESNINVSNERSLKGKEECEQEKVREDSTPSPVEIQIDWDQLDREDLEITPKRVVTPQKYSRSQFNLKNEPVPEVIDELDENQPEISIVVTNMSKDKQKLESYTEKKASQSKQSQKIKNSRAKSDNEPVKQELSKDIESIAELKQQFTLKKDINNEAYQESSKNLGKKYLMLEEEPQIIKYFEQEIRVTQPVSFKKKASAGSVDLQSMTLVEQNREEGVLGDPVYERGGVNYIQLKDELSRKSEVMFIIVVVSFLLYKVIDFVIS